MSTATPKTSSPATDLPKTYDPATIEAEASAAWAREHAFHAEPTDPGEPYSIVIPPPNVTAALHLGHALNNTIQDILTRWHRMAGNNTCWLPGTDHAGIATQTVVEKRVLREEGKRRTEFKRDEFVAKIQAWKDEYEKKITDQLKAMGCSCDFDRQAFTMDEPRAKAVREAFFRLFKDGLIYRGKRLVNWDPVTQTALADDEVEMEEVDGHFYYLRYALIGMEGDKGTRRPGDRGTANTRTPSLGTPGEGRGEGVSYITVATTRPETMLGDTAIAINPKDPRAAALRGKKVLLPIVNREIPIVEDDYVVMPVKYGGDENDAKAQLATGFLKVTPAHDPNDYEIGRRHNLPVLNVLGPDAAISDKHGWPADDFAKADPFLHEQLVGKSREDARKLVVDWFKRNGLLEEVKPYRHSVGHSYRSHVPIEPWLSDQWYCKVTDPRLAGAALRAMAPDQRDPSSSGSPSPGTPGEGRGEGSSSETLTPALSRSTGRGSAGAGKSEGWEGQLRFYPARYAKTFQLWHENLRDWSISRQLWWGHRIPVWSGPQAMSTYDDWTAEPTADDKPVEGKHQLRGKSMGTALYLAFTQSDGTPWFHICIPPGHPGLEAEIERQGYKQDPDVLDTWFSSALWPMSTLNWPDDTPELRVWNPSNVLTTAREIITLWVSRMVMFNLYFRDCLPFYDVFIHAMIQDGEGQKMSKSLGNGVDPNDIIERHGADAMRFTLTSMTTHTQDVRMPVDLVDPHSGQTFQPEKITTPAGYVVAAPVQKSPADPNKKMVSSYGVTVGAAKPTPEMPLAKNTSAKFDEGRKFCNKIWQVALHFAMNNLGKIAPEPVDEQKWSMADRWIVSRLNRTVAEADEALKAYRFDQYAKACYDFFWRDFCDWYVETIKPALRDAARAGQTANVLAAVLDSSLRLMHPMMPFITEVLWWKLNEVRPGPRELPGRIAAAGESARLIKAQWPTVGDFSQAAEHIFPKLQEVVGAIRTVRNQYNVSPRQKVTVSILAPGDSARSIQGNREMIELLATCTLKDARPDLPPVDKAARVSAAGCEIFIEGLVDESAEKQRSDKRREELTKEEAALVGRSSNQAYRAKAPPHLVKQTMDRLAEVRAELAKLG